MKADLIFILISIISCSLYLEYVKCKYGRKSSISRSAKFVSGWLFFTFIVLSIAPLIYLGRESYLTIFSGALLIIIGTVTGYNPALKDDKTENLIHVAATNIGIVGYIIGMNLTDWRLLVIIVPCLVVCGILWIKQVSCHTWKIERLLFYAVWLCYLIKLL